MVNLFSLTKAISNKGVQLSRKCQIITLQMGKNEISFDTFLQHGSSQFLGFELHPNPNHIGATAHPLDINKLHIMFGHPNSQALVANVSKTGFKTKNTLEHTCTNCAICKDKQKNLNKLKSNPSTELGGRINIGISSLQTLSYVGANFWLPASMFYCLQLVKKEISLNVKFIKLDNSRNNKSFHQMVQK
jgi:hypothetical protein